MDKNGRVLGIVFVAGVNVNATMVAQGMAWAYRQYITDRSLIQLEDQAHAARRGLWADPSPIQPWIFRQNKVPRLPQLHRVRAFIRNIDPYPIKTR